MLSRIIDSILTVCAVKCATALSRGETGLKLDMDMFIPYKVVRRDIRCKCCIPLDSAVECLSFSFERSGWSATKSIYMTSVFMCCRNDLTVELEPIRLIFRITKEVEKEIYRYVKDGNLIGIAALLTVAREEVMSPSLFKGLCDPALNGSMSLRQLVLSEIVSLMASQVTLVSTSTSEEVHDELNNKLETMMSMLLLIEVFERVGDKIELYRRYLSKCCGELLAAQMACLLITEGFVEYKDFEVKCYDESKPSSVPEFHEIFLVALEWKFYKGMQLESRTTKIYKQHDLDPMWIPRLSNQPPSLVAIPIRNNEDDAKVSLPLKVSLEKLCYHPYLNDWTPKKSTFKLICILCLPQLKECLESIRLIACKTENIEAICCNLARHGKLIELASLLLVAPEKLIVTTSPGSKYLRPNAIRRCIMSDLQALRESEVRLTGRSNNQKLVEKEMKLSALLLLDVFERAGNSINHYLQSDTYNNGRRSRLEIAVEIQNLLEKAGFAMKLKDADLNDIECFSPTWNPVEYTSLPLALQPYQFSVLEKKHLSGMQKGSRPFHTMTLGNLKCCGARVYAPTSKALKLGTGKNTRQYSYPYSHGCPPPNQGPYAPPPYAAAVPYAYPAAAVPYPTPSPALCYPIPFQHPYPVLPSPAPRPILRHQATFPYPSAYPYPHYSPPEVSSPYIQPGQSCPEFKSDSPSGQDNLISHTRQDSASSLGAITDCNPSAAPSYPPLDEVLRNVTLSESHPTASASPPAPLLSTATSTPEQQSPVHGKATAGASRGHPTHSYSKSWEGGSYYSGINSRHQPALRQTCSFDESKRRTMQVVPSPKNSSKALLLHGNLDIWVCDAVNLPNMAMFHKTLGDMFVMIPANVTNMIEVRKHPKVTSDPYVTIAVGDAVVGRTYVISNTENPVWMQHFNVPVAHYATEVQFVVKDSDVVGSQVIGVVPISVEQIYTGARVEGAYPILNSSGRHCKPGAFMRLSVQYIPMEELTLYHHGVGAGPDYLGVPGTYFPLRMGGKVTLYQDAHVPDGCLPNLKLDHGITYVHGKCWSDIFDAIHQSRRLIYITGWSVWHKVKLVRDGGPASNCTLGDLLRSKSQEGVRVLLMLWDDPTSTSILGYKVDGIMQTHDEEIRRFFKHSSVQVLLCPRLAGKKHSWVKQKEIGTIYTHHQKTVIVDADAGGNRRKLVAFVGGLDLCGGRYDSPHHPLFRTLRTFHKDDYYNGPLREQGTVAGCPRQAWHDLHCKIDGPAAYDVLVNFEERWMKAAKPAGTGVKKTKCVYDDALLRIGRIHDIIGVSDFPIDNENDPEAWHVQIFRSIDSNSVKGFPKDPKEATTKNLVCGKNVLIDMSIHTAYVKAIRAAQHFIYIENQYFLGSSFNWCSNKDLGANNLIPMEIALKIASKIAAQERFAVYIVVPMFPEGVPTGSTTQRILFWQNKTMQMMYETIYKALVDAGLENAYAPQDFLNFFCLGNREADDSQSTAPHSHFFANTPQGLSRKNRRFMIYVHSKGMIVDDEYVIIGSANINQRSMEGTRDTEIAMGAYQPQYTWAKKASHPYGQVYGYRMSLWAEHLGVIEECFTQPESLVCVRQVKLMAENNWKQFAADEVTEMRGHLLKYPITVDRMGKVKPLSGFETFPDVGGYIVGSFLGIQENLTI
ncbi:hypothetical protein V6N13_003132 [Hibiscus sabdariffa]